MRLGRAGGRTYAAAVASSHSSAMDRSMVTSIMITIEFPSMMIKQASAKHPLSASRFLLVQKKNSCILQLRIGLY